VSSVSSVAMTEIMGERWAWKNEAMSDTSNGSFIANK